MGEGAAKIRRSELYEQVWAVPMRTLAQQYGLSDVGLAKICKKHEIPRPPRGYWAKGEALRKPLKTPLPWENTDDIITINANPFHESNPGKQETALEEFALKNLEEPIFVAEDLRQGVRLRYLSIRYELQDYADHSRNADYDKRHP